MFQDHITRDNTVSEQTYQTIMERCPALRESESYKRLFRYIHFADGPQVWDKNTPHKRIPAKLLASIEGGKAPQDFENGRYNAERFLKRYRSEVSPGFRWSGYSATKGLCRIVLDPGTDDLIDLWLNENDSKRRFFLSGKRYNQRAQYRQRNDIVTQHRELESEALYDSQVRIMRYLNTLPYSPFRQTVDQHIGEAMHRSFELALPERHRIRLKNIADYPQPFYSPRPHNARLYAPVSLQNLHKQLRQAIAPAWITLDLAHSQAAIAARQWEIEGLYRLLDSGKPLWEALIKQLRLENKPYERAKEAVKQAYYSVFYGNETGKLDYTYNSLCTENKIRHADGVNFTEAPLVIEALEARERATAAILRNGGCEGAYGFMELPNNLTVPSFLAHVTQTFELEMIDAAFEIAEHRRDFKIMVYIFDGVMIAVDEGCEREVADVLGNYVGERARRFGFPTRLGVDND